MAKKVEEKPAIPHFLAGSGDVMSAVSAYAAAMGQRLSRTLLDYGYRLNRSLNVDGQDAMEGPLTLQPVAGANLPTPSAHPGALVFDTTAQRPAYSDGSAWARMGGFPGPAVTDYGAVGDEVTDDTTAIAAAVADAFTNGLWLFWPPKTFLTTASIPNLHKVRHFGPGAIKRGSDVFYVHPITGLTNTLYVAAAGTSGSDGLSASQPMDIGADGWSVLANALANYGPVLEGTWRIKGAAGTYPGGYIHPRYLHGRNFIFFEGPSVSHPTEPTFRIDHGTDATKTFGMAFTDRVLIDLKNILFTGKFGECVSNSRGTYCWFRNVHARSDGAGNYPVVGLSFVTHCHYFVQGGKIDLGASVRTDLATVDTVTGISELFSCVRSFDTVASAADQLEIVDTQVAFKAKEGCSGHLQYLRITEANTAVELDSGGTSNVANMEIKRAGIGFVLNDTEIHNESGVVWGTGADACGVHILSRGSSRELDFSGWDANDGDPGVRVGQRPLIVIAATYAADTHAGSTSTSETVMWNNANLIPARRLAVEGKAFQIKIVGRVPTGVTLAGDVRILTRLEGQYLIDVTIPSGSAPQGWTAEWNVVSTEDGSAQLISSTLVGATFYDAQTIRRNLDVETNDQDVRVSVIVANAADSITLDSCEVWA